MDCKLSLAAAIVALITPFIPSFLTGVGGWEKVGVSIAATLLYGVSRYFHLKSPETTSDFALLEARVKDMQSKVSSHSLKLGLGKYETRT